MCKFDVLTESTKWSDIKCVKSAVYVMANKYMPGIYKVGYINRENGTLENRIKEQERSEWVVPGSLKIVVVVETDVPELLENKMHNDPDMGETRESNKRELFNRPINEIFTELSNHSKGIATKIYVIEDAARCFGLEYDKTPKMKSHETKPMINNRVYRHRNGFYYRVDETTGTGCLYINDAWTENYAFTNFCKLVRDHGFKITNNRGWDYIISNSIVINQ